MTKSSFNFIRCDSFLKGNSVYIFFITFLFSFSACAQLSYGIKGGLNLADVVINNVIDPDAESDFNVKAGIHAGIFCIATVGNRAGLAAELLYSSKGFKAVTSTHLHYISLPVLVRYSIAEKFVAEGGPELSYLISARSKYGTVTNVWDNKLDLGLDAGLQYLISDKLNVGMRFNAGISSLIRESGTAPSGEKIRYQNRVLQVSLTYTLRQIKL